MVTLRAFEPAHKEALCNYTLPEAQRDFTALPALVFERIAARNQAGDFLAMPVTILFQGAPVGFFVLDSGSDKFVYSDNPQSLLLRSLSVDERQQGQGIGTMAMRLLPDFVKENYPIDSITEIALGVNVNNVAAYNLYLKVGCKDEGKQIEGPHGMQYVLTLQI